ncbi:serine protease [Bradyrhizobium sp. CCBAU 51753]|uniref:serine protease n=1 Tax=Bradyrhizobium sp. CCBAU 51753 TaxID=1325100 RepID=UPI00188AE929|nr:serine protease [Bradyrhizobium sp. CCBAU 51753]QOZ24138.1 hypothetical protein XH93_11550 [Bradyrhizobium sp. CCBAU 51753]
MAGVANIFEQRAWLARIWSNEKRASLIGTAFAIDKRHLLTCHHVVHEAGATAPGGRVYLDFPLANKTGIWCTALADGWCPTPAKDDPQSAGDLALLKIDDGLPDLTPLPLRLRKSYAGLAFSSYGFTKQYPEGDAAHGQISLMVGLEWLRIEAASEALLQPGFSGAPVFVEELEGAVGVVVTRNTANGRASYAVPMNVISRSNSVVRNILDQSPLAWVDTAPRSLRAEIITSARSLIDDRTRDFVGRQFVFDAIDKELENAAAGYVIIKGEPGIGKSAIMASLADRRGYLHHFNVFSDNIRSPDAFLANACAQVISKYELPYGTVPASATKNSNMLFTLLEEASQQLENLQSKIVLLVDALDEANEPEQGVNRLYLPRRLPDRCFVVATIRSNVKEHLLLDQRLAPIEISENSAQNEADIRTYIAAFLDRNHADISKLPGYDKLDQTAFADTLWAKSEGNFMYLHVVLDAVLKKQIALSDVANPDILPSGLTGYYERHWQLMHSPDRAKRRGLQEPVICFLALAKKAVPAEVISEWMNDSRQFERVAKHFFGIPGKKGSAQSLRRDDRSCHG